MRRDIVDSPRGSVVDIPVVKSLSPVFRYTSTSGLRHAGQVADPEQPFTELPPDRTGRGSTCTCSTVQGSSLQRLYCKHRSVVLRGAIAIGPVYSPRHPDR